MKTEEKIERYTLYTSDVVPGVATTDEGLAEVIAWADANPKVWRIVRENKSKLFGRNGNHYHGCERGEGADRVLDRAAHFRWELKKDTVPFFQWRARFTLEYYGEKGFKTGFFQQFDGTYDRNCTYLDYVPGTLEEVINQFAAWCDTGPCRYSTVAIKLDGKVVRKYPAAEETGE